MPFLHWQCSMRSQAMPGQAGRNLDPNEDWPMAECDYRTVLHKKPATCNVPPHRPVPYSAAYTFLIVYSS